ncbi:hypothetical protein MANES_15G003840v8 [Manihot esculenta]|uniref:Uncharacterized protein n=1 Tax=Manihot esculenta TaxID=3983 RepID=A0ACB7G993_MANES|nr:hypothetical protein MANES_15G003840v8 [Manihot esculenta]
MPSNPDKVTPGICDSNTLQSSIIRPYSLTLSSTLETACTTWRESNSTIHGCSKCLLFNQLNKHLKAKVSATSGLQHGNKSESASTNPTSEHRSIQPNDVAAGANLREASTLYLIAPLTCCTQSAETIVVSGSDPRNRGPQQ